MLTCTLRLPENVGPTLLLALLALASPGTVAGDENAPPDDAHKLAFFESKIRPVLAEKCYSCHSVEAKKLKAGLYLDSQQGMLAGGDNGAAIVPGKPGQSRLVEAMRYVNIDLQMPPKEKLDSRVVEAFEQWIAWGAPWPAGEEGGAARDQGEEFSIALRKAGHWAWQPVADRPAPELDDNQWSQQPIDRFVLAKLREQGMTPAEAADRRTLVRRLFFDLIGLPPTPEQVEAFVDDTSEDAYSRVVDTLLESPHFGERWARHWLDLVRYAETRGHEFDHTVPNAFRYRDYVIRAFNADIPYNQLVTEHIAGDLLPAPRVHPEEGFNESVIGTGFWFLGENIHSPVDIKQDEADRFDNMVDVASKSFLALTVACARCHDHKFDAISTKDYYAMFGFLQSSSYRQAPIDSMLPNKAIADQMRVLEQETGHAIAAALGDALKPGLDEAAAYLLAALAPEGTGAAAAVLDTARLQAWREAVQGARTDASAVLHAVASDSGSAWLAAEQHRAATLRAQREAMVMVADYATIGQDAFLQDGGFGFGVAPVRPGNIRLDDGAAGANAPPARVETHGAARRDPVWSLQEVIDSDRDPASQTSQQPGRMLRTPTFVLREPGLVHYLVRGKGTAMAVVDSHRLVLGPLHGNVHRKLDGQDGLRWEAHELSRYIGHNLHVEFVPEGDAPFEIVMVAQSADGAAASLPDPQAIEHPPLGQLATALQQACSTAAQVDALASSLVQAMRQWRDSCGAGGEPCLPSEQARLVDWILSHPGLFASDPEAALEPARLIAQRFRQAHAALASGIVHKSRTVLSMMDGTPFDDTVYIRGSYKSPGETVPRRFLEALGGADADAPAAHGSGRLELARQVTDPDNPFVSRVIVNRLWHHLFGRGIVPTTDDFGYLGQRPSHPELLDHLAHAFVADGWSIKRQIRRIVLSRTYQLSSRAAQPEAERRDPQNVWLHRANVRRLQSEAIRDAILAVSGRLDRTPFGRPVPVHLSDFMTGRGRPGSSGPVDGDGRRSIYLEVRRNFLNPMMLAFDTPIPFNAMGRRSVSNVPSQALILMNDPFVIGQAEVWARRILSLPLDGDAQRVNRMYREALSRPATEDELAAALRFVEQGANGQEGATDPAAAAAAWADLAHVLLNAKEFIFVN